VDDLNTIKEHTDLCRSKETTYIVFGANLVSDMNTKDLSYQPVADIANRLNKVIAVTDGSAMQVTNYNADVSKPVLVSVDLNMDTPQLTFVFEETVEAASLQVIGITIQNAAQVTPDQSDSYYRLTEGTVSAKDDTTVRVDITWKDANEIKARTGLATALNNAFVVIDQQSLKDMFGNANAKMEAQVRVGGFTADTTEPTLRSFGLNMDSRTLVMEFSETVLATTLQVAQLTLQDAVSASTPE
jgi:hypothetical protein